MEISLSKLNKLINKDSQNEIFLISSIGVILAFITWHILIKLSGILVIPKYSTSKKSCNYN
jgi:hypothetical protein